MSLNFHTVGEAGKIEEFTQKYLDSLPKSRYLPMGDIHPSIPRLGPSATLSHSLHPEAVDVEEIAIPVRDGTNIRVRIYRTSENAVGAPLIYLHGGCWIFCSIDSHDAIARYLCKQSGMTVFSIDYRLAPEYKFPTGFNDCYDCTKWISQNYQKLNLSTNEPIVSGDSAGGNLACATALAAARSKEFKIRGQLLFYPVADISKKTESYKKFSTGYFLTEDLMDYGAKHYTSNEQERFNPLISLVNATDLHLLPKTLIQTAEFDVLRDEAEDLAKLMHNAGTDVECVRYNGTIHAYIALAGKIPIGRKALDHAVYFLKSLNS